MFKTGAKNLITDVKGVLVGNSHDETLKSGVTVFSADTAFTASYTVMGGAPGTRETDLLAPDKMITAVDALALSGGSAFGVDAAAGVVDCLRSKGRGFRVASQNIPIVPAAILFDLANGGHKDWTVNPYPKLGNKAYRSLSSDFDLGSIGAGFGAQCGMIKGGLGSASFVLSTGVTIGALAAVNPIGNVTDSLGKHFWAAPFEINSEFGGLGPPKHTEYAQSLNRNLMGSFSNRSNTTIAIVATDAILNKAQIQRMCTAAHDGFARAIIPSHMPYDGDLIFGASTGKFPMTEEPFAFSELCHAASICIARAVARGVYHAVSFPGDILDSWQNRNANSFE